MREKLWNLLDKTRFEYNYYQEYRQYLERCRIVVVVATSLVLFLVLGLSLLFEGHALLWNLLLLASGATALVFEKLMIADKITALKYCIPELNAQLDGMHTEWLEVNELYDFSDEEIWAIFTQRMRALSHISEKYLDNLHLPEHKKSVEKASHVTKIWAERFS